MNETERDAGSELLMTAAAMREADRATADEHGIAGFTLMETAGRAVAEGAERHFGPLAGRRVLIFCGPGNNGGDGLVAARVLHARGAIVDAILLADEGAYKGDAAAHLRVLKSVVAATGDRLRVHAYDADMLPHGHADLYADLYIDAMLGTGISEPLRPPYAEVVRWLNGQAAPVLAVDLPTGLHADTGEILGEVVRAALTVTMAARKQGLVLGDGPGAAGIVEVAEIGIPTHLLERGSVTLFTTDALLKSWLPRRTHHSHKYSIGLAVVVGGASGFTGAPTMSSLAAARAGAGAVICACPQDVQAILAQKLTEVMTLGLPAGADGIEPDAALSALQPKLEKAKALLVGPGLGRGEHTNRFVRKLLSETDLPTVIDADGLFALAQDPEMLRAHSGKKWILTPHAGEFERLAGEKVDLTDRVAVARRFAAKWDCVLVLKGLPAVVATPEGRVYVSGTGNPALATAGTGDVLAGLCVGLLAQGLAPAHAAAGAVHLGGAAADRYAEHFSARSLLATDLPALLPILFKERFS